MKHEVVLRYGTLESIEVRIKWFKVVEFDILVGKVLFHPFLYLVRPFD